MGSKSILTIGLIIVGVFLYLSLGQLTNNQPTQKPVIIAHKVKVDKVHETTKIEPIQRAVVERIATPAFGFMATTNKHQIVALISDNDQNGSLVNYLDKVCQEYECIKDIRYENDIIDAPWQETAAKILDLIVHNNIKDGSLFIESNTLKIEGKISDYETKTTLDSILKSAKEENLTIESYTTLSKNIQKDINTTTLDITPPKETNNTSIEQPAKPAQAEASEVKKPIDKKPTIHIKAQPVKKKDTKVIKKRVKKPEVVPTPVMETTFENSITSTNEKETEDQSPVKGIVATPYMSTTKDRVVTINKQQLQI
ncbi:MAG: hypothetical protein K0U47_01295, partial [Epsilonproteobacteria bacterium]|nr:hypothetical protein [Campylobacterota bacterium]